LALTEDGKVYSWGWNEEGQLGTNKQESEASPFDITSSFPAETKIIDIFAGRYANALAISSDGELFGWGSNENVIIKLLFTF
jgi:alpha-tubulin suppressor-like RCC1 family protein